MEESSPLDHPAAQVELEQLRRRVSFLEDQLRLLKAAAEKREPVDLGLDFQIFSEMSYDGIVVCNEEGSIIEWNYAAEQIMKIPKAEVLGKKIWDLRARVALADHRTQEAIRRVQVEFYNYARTGISPWKERVIEHQNVRPDGTLVITHSVLFPIPGQNGFKIGAIVRDVTDSKRHEADLLAAKTELEGRVVERTAELRRANQMLTDFLESTQDPIAAFDEEWRCQYANRAYSNFLRREHGAMIGKKIWEEFPQLSNTPVAENLRKARRENQPLHFTVQGVLTASWSDISIYPTKDLVWIFSRDRTVEHKAAEALAEGERRYHSLFDNLLYGVILVQTGGGILSANAQACRMLDMTEEEIRERGAGIMVMDEKLAQAMGEHSRLGQVMAEINLRRKDGTVFPVEGTIVQYIDVDGSLKTSISFQDISARKETEARLRQSEQKYRSLVENINDLVCEVDFQGNFLYLSPRYTEIMGYRPEELLGTNVTALIHPDGQYAGIQKLQKLAEEGGQARDIWRFRHKNGSWRWIESLGSVIDQGSSQSTVVVISRDIGERLDAEKKLRESEQALKRAQRIARLGSWKLDIARNHLEVSEELYRIFDLAPQDESALSLISRIRQRIHAEDQPKLAKIFQVTQSERRFPPFEARLRWSDGSIHSIYVEAGEALDPEGDGGYLTGIVLDVTERKNIEEALRHSEKRLNQAIHIANLGIWEWDLTTGKVELNDEMFSILGLSHAEFDGRGERFLDFTHPDYREKQQAAMQHSIEQGMTESELHAGTPVQYDPVELCVVRTDGSLRYVIGDAITILDDHRRPQRLLGILQDITAQKNLETHLAEQRDELTRANLQLAHELFERQQTELRLRENRLLTQAIMDHSPSLIYVKDTQGRMVLVNHEMEKKFGQTDEKLKLKTSFDLLPEEIAGEHHQHDMGVIQSGIASQFEEFTDGPDGKRIYLSQKFPLYDENKNILGVCAISTDITERRASEIALREAELKYKIVAENTFDWVFWLDPAGKFVYNSPSCERITGYPVEAFFEDPDLALRIIHPADQNIYLAHRETMNRQHRGGQIMFRILHKNGQERWLEHSCQPVFGAAGVFLGERGSNRDFTERKRAESLLKELEVLRGINQLRDELIGNVSHELRTPLGLILVMVTALRKDDLNLAPNVRLEFLQDIEDETRSLQGIVNNLLDTSLLQSGKLKLNPKAVDLSKLIFRLVEQMRLKSPLHLIYWQHPSRPVIAVVDAQRIEQVLLNLLDNAVKYSGVGKKITVKLSQSRTEIQVQVKNQGETLPLEEYERIFARFYRIVDPNDSLIPGLGLGLPISRDIVEAHGGRLWGEGSVEGGSIFTLTLPRLAGSLQLEEEDNPNEPC